jgi:hypothetical protein
VQGGPHGPPWHACACRSDLLPSVSIRTGVGLSNALNGRFGGRGSPLAESAGGKEGACLPEGNWMVHAPPRVAGGSTRCCGARIPPSQSMGSDRWGRRACGGRAASASPPRREYPPCSPSPLSAAAPVRCRRDSVEAELVNFCFERSRSFFLRGVSSVQSSPKRSKAL